MQQQSDPAPVAKQVIATEPEMEVFDIDFSREFSDAMAALLYGPVYKSEVENGPGPERI